MPVRSFCYYGLRGILTLYATRKLGARRGVAKIEDAGHATAAAGFDEPTAVSIFSYSSAFAYMMPLLGGYLSDTYFGKCSAELRLSQAVKDTRVSSFAGKYRVIVAGTAIYLLGCAVLTFTAINSLVWGLFLGLALIAVGTGTSPALPFTLTSSRRSGAIKPCVSSFGADQLPHGAVRSVESRATHTRTHTNTLTRTLARTHAMRDPRVRSTRW